MKRKNTQKNGDYSLAHVLYQKLGNDWYAFTEVDGDCFMAKVDEETALSQKASEQEEERKISRTKRRAA